MTHTIVKWIGVAVFGASVAVAGASSDTTTDTGSSAETVNTSTAAAAPGSVSIVNKGDGVRLTFAQKVKVYNASKSDDQKLYCRRDTVTGSHKKKMRCVTLADRRAEEDAARAFFRAVRK